MALTVAAACPPAGWLTRSPRPAAAGRRRSRTLVGSPLSRSPACSPRGPHALADNPPGVPQPGPGRRQQERRRRAPPIGSGRSRASSRPRLRAPTVWPPRPSRRSRPTTGPRSGCSRPRAPPCRPSRPPTPRRPRWVSARAELGRFAAAAYRSGGDLGGLTASSWRATASGPDQQGRGAAVDRRQPAGTRWSRCVRRRPTPSCSTSGLRRSSSVAGRSAEQVAARQDRGGGTAGRPSSSRCGQIAAQRRSLVRQLCRRPAHDGPARAGPPGGAGAATGGGGPPRGRAPRP